MAMGVGTVPLLTINKTNGAILQTTPNTVVAAVSGSNVSALRPGDISVVVTGGIGINLGANNYKPTSASMSFDLAREDINKLGSKFAFAKEIDFPVTVSFTCDGILADLSTAGIDSLDEVVSGDFSAQLGGPQDITNGLFVSVVGVA